MIRCNMLPHNISFTLDRIFVVIDRTLFVSDNFERCVRAFVYVCARVCVCVYVCVRVALVDLEESV